MPDCQMTPITQISKNVVTYVSPVEVFANANKIFSWQKLSVIALSISSELLELKVEFQSEQQDWITDIRNLLCSKSTKCKTL